MHKILIIDDEKEVVSLLKDFFSSRNYEVVSAPDGSEGLKKVETEKPDLVLCDIKMPEKDGFQFLKELRATMQWIPVVIVSALTDPTSILKGYGLDADYYITKPINLEECLKVVRIMISLAPLRKK